MKFENLIKKTFFEKDFYELLLFDIEENFDQYFSKFIHVYFERFEGQKIRISDVVFFGDEIHMYKKSREIIEKKEWFEVAENHGHFNLFLVRIDRTGLLSTIYRDSSRTQESCRSWADEWPDQGPMTPDEIRQAFRELSGLIDDLQEPQNLRSKKAI